MARITGMNAIVEVTRFFRIGNALERENLNRGEGTNFSSYAMHISFFSLSLYLNFSLFKISHQVYSKRLFALEYLITE